MKLSQKGREHFSLNDEVDISSLVGEHTTESQFDALTSLATSIGLDSFSRSTLLKKHNARCFQCAAGQFLVWSRKPGDSSKRRQEREIYYYGYQQEP